MPGTHGPAGGDTRSPGGPAPRAEPFRPGLGGWRLRFPPCAGRGSVPLGGAGSGRGRFAGGHGGHVSRERRLRPGTPGTGCGLRVRGPGGRPGTAGTAPGRGTAEGVAVPREDVPLGRCGEPGPGPARDRAGRPDGLGRGAHGVAGCASSGSYGGSGHLGAFSGGTPVVGDHGRDGPGLPGRSGSHGPLGSRHPTGSGHGGGALEDRAVERMGRSGSDRPGAGRRRFGSATERETGAGDPG